LTLSTIFYIIHVWTKVSLGHIAVFKTQGHIAVAFFPHILGTPCILGIK